MNKRPLPVTIIALVYIFTGAVGLVSHLANVRFQRPFEYDIVGIAAVSLIALMCGIYMLRGHNWARWGALAWMAFHVVLSAFHPWLQLAMHCVFLAAISYFLFQPAAKQYFRASV
jgi:hypothetical protein